MKIFLDANVLVAVLNKEYPYFSLAARVLSFADRSGFELYTSPVCLAIAFYFAEKKSGAVTAKKKVVVLTDKIQIAAVDLQAVQLAAGNRSVQDFEDGLEYYAAFLAGCQAIITEDGSGFFFSVLPVYNCDSFLTQHDPMK